MSAVALLVGLLALAYIGSVLVGGRGIRGYGLPSGSEYLLVGILFGPSALGLVDRATLGQLEPLIEVGLAWFAFVIGVSYGSIGTRSVSVRRLFAGTAISALVAVGVAAVFAIFALAFTRLTGRDVLIASAGIGAVSCETTRHAVRWVVERHEARGPLSTLIGDLADADDLVPLLGLTLAFALAGAPTTPWAIPGWTLAPATLGVGLVLGAFASALLRVEDRTTQTWGILLGVALFGIGTAARFGQSALGLLFALGLGVAALSGRKTELRAMLAPTEHAVLLPLLVIAGVSVDWSVPDLWVVGAVVLFSRITLKWASATLVRLSRSGKPAGGLLGLALLPAGSMTMAIGLAFSLRFDSQLGRMVLAVAALCTLFGELVGPTSLKRVLVRAGEIEHKSAPFAAAPELGEGGKG